MRLHEIGQQSRLSETMGSSLAAVRGRIADLLGRMSGSTDELPSTAARAALFHLNAGGQGIRTRLASYAAMACGIGEEDGVALASVAELLHNASLVHDDVQDHTRMRRGCDAIWVTFGADVAVCAGDLMLSAAYAALAGLSNTTMLPALLELVHDRVSAAIRGQCADLSEGAARGTDLARYEAVAVGKSGALLSLPLEMVFTAAGKCGWVPQARIAAERFAIGYQIADDLQDLAGDATAEKGALNIVLVLGMGEAALVEARRLGQQHLRAAASAALALPHGAGTLLQEMASTLAATLAPVATR